MQGVQIEQHGAYGRVVNDLVEQASLMLGDANMRAMLHGFCQDRELASFITVSKDRVTLRGEAKTALELFVERLTQSVDHVSRIALLSYLKHSCEQHDLPMPVRTDERRVEDDSNHWFG